MLVISSPSVLPSNSLNASRKIGCLMSSTRASPSDRWNASRRMDRSRNRPPSTRDLDADVPERVRDPAWQLSDLACYLVNLADDLQEWLARGSIDPEVLPQVREELRQIAKARHRSADLADSGNSGSASADAPWFVAATRSTHIRR